MKKVYLKKNVFLLFFLFVFLFSNNVSSQVEFHYLPGFSTSLFDINNSGKAVSSSGVYDFILDTTVPMDTIAVSLSGINNNGDLIGTMPLNVNGNIIEQPAYKRNGVWHAVGYFPGYTDQATVSTAQISENGNFINGQMSTDCCSQQAFLYNTNTGVLEKIADTANLYSAGYSVNNTGIIGGWFDQQPGGGTLRVPAYMTTGSVVTAIPGSLPTSSVNAVNAINNSNIMVGDKDQKPFIYDLTNNTFTQFAIPSGYTSATFTSISDNGIAVGYCDKFDAVVNREAIIYHPNLGSQPVFLSVILNSFGITNFGTVDGKLGTAMAISPDGKYICGWDNNMSVFASGWAVSLKNLLFTSCFTICPDNITVVSLAGPKVVNYTVPSFICPTHPNATMVLASGLVSGSSFPIGTTTNVFNLVDSGITISTCSFDVIVNDFYCIPSIPLVEPITLLNFAGINNSSSVDSLLEYENFTTISGNVNQGGTYSSILKGTTNGDYTDYFTAFVDWNQDGDFNDISERYELGSITNSTGIDGIQATGSIHVPIDALLGTTTLRIIKTDGSYDTSYCNTGSSFMGQAEDYRLVVSTNLSVNSVGNSNLIYYPNPVKNKFYVSNNSEIELIEIYNVLGLKVISKTLNSKTAIIDLSDLKAGTYFVKTFIGNSITTLKMIKE
ncbi:MAG: T9SS type A sorting domain-containing protein [Bacteroidota bacterium]